MLQEDEPKNRWLAASAAKAIVFKERNEINKQSNSDSNTLESAKKRADGKDFPRSEISDERDRRSNRATNHNHYDDENDRRHNRTSTLNLFDDNNDQKIDRVPTPSPFDGYQTPPHLRRTLSTTRNYRDAWKLKSLKKSTRYSEVLLLIL